MTSGPNLIPYLLLHNLIPTQKKPTTPNDQILNSFPALDINPFGRLVLLSILDFLSLLRVRRSYRRRKEFQPFYRRRGILEEQEEEEGSVVLFVRKLSRGLKSG
jgi:hypothetical protein